VLVIFIYFNFFNANFEAIARFFHLNYPVKFVRIILPIGLSFHTFQSLSYVIEVYRGKQKAEHNFGIYSLYVMFYPQLVAGPIERPQNLLHQFYEKHNFEYRRVADGLKLMAWGMFKKIVIADRLAIAVNYVYNNPHDYTGFALIAATIFFTYQIYCDFSGYSDIAIGAAQVMGFKLMDNFNRPYFSRSLAEFWKRWHISLSSWFRDYVYIALGGNRVAKLKWTVNILITFLISGLWHGANWTYVVWGAVNGSIIIFSSFTKKIREYCLRITGLAKLPALHRGIQVSITFLTVSLLWIIFRANNISEAVYIMRNLFSGIARVNITSQFKNLGMPESELAIGVFLIIFLEIIHVIQRHGSIRHMLADKPAYLRWPVYYCLLLGIVCFGEFGKNQFIYFQF